MVGDETFAEDLDNRNTARDAGFEIDWGIGLVSLGDEFVASFGEEGFIGGDEGLSCLKASLGNLKRIGHAADEFDHDLHGGIGDHFPPIGDGLYGQAFAYFGDVLDCGRDDLEMNIEAFAEKGVGLGKVPDQS